MDGRIWDRREGWDRRKGRKGGNKEAVNYLFIMFFIVIFTFFATKT